MYSQYYPPFPYQAFPGAPQLVPPKQYSEDFKPHLSVFISDFEESLGGPDIFNYFKKFGQISDVKKMQKKASAIVSFYEEKDAQRAIVEGNHSKILDKHIRVIKYSANRKEQHQNRNPGRGAPIPSTLPLELPSNSNLYVKLDKTVTIKELDDLILRLVRFTSHKYVSSTTFTLETSGLARDEIQGSLRLNNQSAVIVEGKNATLLSASEDTRADFDELRSSIVDLILRRAFETGSTGNNFKTNQPELLAVLQEEIQKRRNAVGGPLYQLTMGPSNVEGRIQGVNNPKDLQNLLRECLSSNIQGQLSFSNQSPQRGNYLLLTFAQGEDQNRVRNGNIGNLVRELNFKHEKTPLGLLYKEDGTQELSLVDKKICNLIEVGNRDKIASSKIRETERGESLGYGYVQLVDKDDADRCKNREIDLKGRAILKLYTREREKQNSEVDNVLYLRDFRQDLTKDDIERTLKELANENNFGFLDYRSRGSVSFALAYFRSKNVAEHVRNLLQQSNAHGLGETLYVNFCHNSKSTVAIYTKNLKEDVQEDQILEAFRGFGIVRCSVKQPKVRENSNFPRTLFAFLYFKKDNSGVNGTHHDLIQKKHQNNPNLQPLYHDGKIYFEYLQSKEKREEKLRKKGHQRDFPPFPFGAPYLPFQMFPVNRKYMPMQAGFNPSQGYNPYFQMGYPNQYQGQGHHHNHHHHNNHYNQNYHNQYNRQGYKPQDQANPQANVLAGNNAPIYNRNFAGHAGNVGNQQGNTNSYNSLNSHRGRGGQRRPYRGYSQGQGRTNYQNNRNQNHTDNTTQNSTSANIPQNNFTIEKLKDNLSEFLGYPKDEQRKILGGMLFPRVEKFSTDQSRTPKITGMLVDFDVFEVNEILEFLENDSVLKERVAEAEDLISKNA